MSRRRSLVSSLLAPLLAALLAAGIPTTSVAQGATPVDSQAIASEAKPLAAFSASALALRDSIVALARAQTGRRYRFGGQSPDGGFDCSGLVRYIMAALKIDLPRTASQQAGVGVEVPRDTARLRPGDLLTFGRGSRVTHIGIYVGGGRFVHASTKAGRVIESSLERRQSPLVRSWSGVRRLAAAETSAPVTP